MFKLATILRPLLLSLVLSFVFSSAARADDSFETAKTTYLGLHRAAESQVAALESELRAALAPIQDEIKDAEKQRDACASYDCADKLSGKIAALRALAAKTTAPYAEKEQAARASLAQAGRELALDAYAQEVAVVVSQLPGAKLLAATHDLPCATTVELGAPSHSSSCRMSTLEFRVGQVFYRSTIAYGLPLLASAPAPAIAGLDAIFSGTREEFVKPTIVPHGGLTVDEGILQPQASLNTMAVVEGGKRAYAFSRGDEVGYVMIEVKHTP